MAETQESTVTAPRPRRVVGTRSSTGRTTDSGKCSIPRRAGLRDGVPRRGTFDTAALREGVGRGPPGRAVM
jgi:hypothetical protein